MISMIAGSIRALSDKALVLGIAGLAIFFIVSVYNFLPL